MEHLGIQKIKKMLNIKIFFKKLMLTTFFELFFSKNKYDQLLELM